MALLRVNAEADRPVFDADALDAALARLAPGQPVVVMLHGYRFHPGRPGTCPHDHILSLTPAPGVPRAISWPRHLHLDREGAGLGIAFGWPARGALPQAYARAATASVALARLVVLIRQRDPGRPVDAIAHSLGARVVLQAMPHLQPGDLGRVILLSPAEFRRPATRAMLSPAGRAAEVLSVTSRENALFDLLLETLAGAGLRRSVSRGHRAPCANWTGLWIDHPGAMAALDALGFPLGPAERRICHWSPYLRPGVFALYRAILAGDLPLAALRVALPEAPDARLSRRQSVLRLPDPHLTLPANPA